MYLSRLILDVRQPRVRRDLSDVYRLHRTILSAFPQAPDNVPARAHFGILYRIEPISDMPWLVRLLVQSREQPIGHIYQTACSVRRSTNAATRRYDGSMMNMRAFEATCSSCFDCSRTRPGD